MRVFWTLCKHEMKSVLLSPAFYVTTMLFLLLMGGSYLLILMDFLGHEQDVLPSIVFFKFFWLPLFFMIPLLTMRSFAESKQLGILESLRATPASMGGIVWAKFLSAYVFYLFLWGLTLTFPFIVKYSLSTGAVDSRILDVGSWAGGFLFIALSGFSFIALGIFTSSLTKSQLIAGILCFCFLFVIVVGGRALVEWPLIPNGDMQGYFQVFDHLDEFSRGMIDTRPFVFYISLGVLILQTTTILLEAND